MSDEQSTTQYGGESPETIEGEYRMLPEGMDIGEDGKPVPMHPQRYGAPNSPHRFTDLPAGGDTPPSAHKDFLQNDTTDPKTTVIVSGIEVERIQAWGSEDFNLAVVMAEEDPDYEDEEEDALRAYHLQGHTANRNKGRDDAKDVAMGQRAQQQAIDQSPGAIAKVLSRIISRPRSGAEEQL